MSVRTPPRRTSSRSALVEATATALPQRAGLLSRLLYRHARRHARTRLSRSGASVLAALADAPKRITELAELEGQLQPTITTLVDKLEARGWVRREHDAADRRVVLVALTETGRATLEEYRSVVRDLLITRLSALPDEDLRALATAVDVISDLIDVLQQGDDR